jgi:SAM-dependent methyltransferase
MESRFLRVVNDVEADLRRCGQLSDYFTLLRPHYVNDLIRINDAHRGGAVLEIGGYPFYFSMCLRRLGIELTTVDLAPHRARELIRENSLKVVKCDIEREPLPFEDHSISTIALCQTFEHLRIDPFFALEQMRRVLQPDGLLYLTTPNLYRLGNILSFAVGRGLAFDPIREFGKLRSVGHMGHVREYTETEMRRFLEAAGFVGVKVEKRAAPSRRGKLVDAVHRVLPGIRGDLVVTGRAAGRPS